MRPFEHYIEAERLLELGKNRLHPEIAMTIFAEAQVHATLALVVEGKRIGVQTEPN